MSGLKIWFGSLVLKVAVFVSLIFCINPDDKGKGYKEQRNVEEP